MTISLRNEGLAALQFSLLCKTLRCAVLDISLGSDGGRAGAGLAARRATVRPLDYEVRCSAMDPKIERALSNEEQYRRTASAILSG
jgi:hypothetical protein